MAYKTALVEITVAYKVYMDRYGEIVKAEPMLDERKLEELAIEMADGAEFEMEDV